MNVDGMPWYLEKKEKQPEPEKIELTKEESRAMMGGILKATLLVTLAFGVGLTLFILLCDLFFSDNAKAPPPDVRRGRKKRWKTPEEF